MVTETLFEGFESLMPFRVQDILLVSSLYDSFILREDGRLNELLIGESLELNLQQIPGITQVSTGKEALARYQPRFNLIVTNVPGPPVPLYLLGAELRECYPMLALLPNTVYQPATPLSKEPFCTYSTRRLGMS